MNFNERTRGEQKRRGKAKKKRLEKMKIDLGDVGLKRKSKRRKMIEKKTERTRDQ